MRALTLAALGYWAAAVPWWANDLAILVCAGGLLSYRRRRLTQRP